MWRNARAVVKLNLVCMNNTWDGCVLLLPVAAEERHDIYNSVTVHRGVVNQTVTFYDWLNNIVYLGYMFGI